MVKKQQTSTCRVLQRNVRVRSQQQDIKKEDGQESSVIVAVGGCLLGELNSSPDKSGPGVVVLEPVNVVVENKELDEGARG